MTELKPCPFCGCIVPMLVEEKSKICDKKNSVIEWRFRVRCPECFASAQWFGTLIDKQSKEIKDRAVKAWNRRFRND